MEGDQMACLELFMTQEQMDDPKSLIIIAERIKKVIQDKLNKKMIQKASTNKFSDKKWIQQFQLKQNQEKNNFPKRLELEVEEFNRKSRRS